LEKGKGDIATVIMAKEKVVIIIVGRV